MSEVPKTLTDLTVRRRLHFDFELLRAWNGGSLARQLWYRRSGVKPRSGCACTSLRDGCATLDARALTRRSGFPVQRRVAEKEALMPRPELGEDRSGLLEWAAKDRAVVTFSDGKT